MNSGMRVSVAIIVLVVIFVGFYYAGLDDDGAGRPLVIENAVKPSATPASTAPPNAEPEAVPTSFEKPEAPVDPEVAESTPTDGRQQADVAAGNGLEPAGDGSSDPVLVINDVEVPAVPDPQLDSLEPATDPEEPVALSKVSESVEIELPTEEDTEIVNADDPDDEGGMSSSAASVAGRLVGSKGLGGHVIVTTEPSPAALTEASRALAQASESLVAVPAGKGLSWVAIPTAVKGNPLLESAIISTSGAEGVEYLLVREDANGSLELDGRIAEAESAGFPGTDMYRVRYRVTSQELDAVRRDSSRLVGLPVAWFVDGALVAVSKPRIAISQRSMLPVSVDEIAADRIARAITASPEVESSGVDGAIGSAVAIREGRPARAGELPEVAYTIYVVKSSDTPSSIARWWFGDDSKLSLILQANPLVDPTRLMPGDELRLPPKDFELRTIISDGEDGGPVVHIVQSGENLSEIALAAYGDASLWPRIQEANADKIKDPAKLEVGMELIIP